MLRVDVQANHLVIELRAAKKEPPPGREDGKPPSRESGQLEADRIVLRVPWKKPPSKRRREIIVPQSAAPQDARPIRAETRATLVASIGRGRRWLDEIVAGAVTVEQIAVREQCSIRQVNMTISLAFLAPSWCRRPSKDDCPGVLASLVCAMLLSSGAANMRCLAYRFDSRRWHAGSVRRVPAAEVEALVDQAVRERLKDSASPDGDLIRAHVARVDVQTDHLVIAPGSGEAGQPPSGDSSQLEADSHCPPCALEETAVKTAARDHRAPIGSATGRSPDPR